MYRSQSGLPYQISTNNNAVERPFDSYLQVLGGEKFIRNDKKFSTSSLSNFRVTENSEYSSHLLREVATFAVDVTGNYCGLM